MNRHDVPVNLGTHASADTPQDSNHVALDMSGAIQFQAPTHIHTIAGNRSRNREQPANDNDIPLDLSLDDGVTKNHHDIFDSLIGCYVNRIPNLELSAVSIGFPRSFIVTVRSR